MEKLLETKTRTYFFRLVQELDKVEGIERLRISSMSLIYWKNETILFQNRTLYIFHIPLSQEVTRFWKCGVVTNVKYILKRVKLEVMPHACIGVDVIVGSWWNWWAFLGNLSLFEWNGHLLFTCFQVFWTWNTEAAEMLGVVPENVRVKRSKMMRGLSVKKRRLTSWEHENSSLKAKIKRVTFMVLLKTTLK
jgi:threonylcarbamoyladenosine tRNA methylthiotransferase MtaB